MPRPAGRTARRNAGDLVTLYAEVAQDVIGFVDDVAACLNCGRAEAVEEIVRKARGDLPDGARPDWVYDKMRERQLPLDPEAIAPVRQRRRASSAA